MPQIFYSGTVANQGLAYRSTSLYYKYSLECIFYKVFIFCKNRHLMEANAPATTDDKNGGDDSEFLMT